MKAVRITDGIHVIDWLGSKRFQNGHVYTVTFSDGSTVEKPVIVKRQMIMQTDTPFFVMREQAFFEVDYRGIRVWARAIDLDDIV
jgi:hypothetical protein